MDKNLSRKILFNKKGDSGEPPKPKQKIVSEVKPFVNAVIEKVLEIQEKAISRQNTALKIVLWINSHPEFKWSAMCRKIGLDKGNFQKVLKSNEPVIKEALIPKIVEILKQYGYAE